MKTILLYSFKRILRYLKFDVLISISENVKYLRPDAREVWFQGHVGFCSLIVIFVLSGFSSNSLS